MSAMDEGRYRGRFKHASTSEAGDFCQVHFAKSDGDDEERYVLIQSQFEFPQAYDVKIEADGGALCAELNVDKAKLGRSSLDITGKDGRNQMCLAIQFAVGDEGFSEIRRVLRLMIPSIVVPE